MTVAAILGRPETVLQGHGVEITVSRIEQAVNLERGILAACNFYSGKEALLSSVFSSEVMPFAEELSIIRCRFVFSVGAIISGSHRPTCLGRTAFRFTTRDSSNYPAATAAPSALENTLPQPPFLTSPHNHPGHCYYALSSTNAKASKNVGTCPQKLGKYPIANHARQRSEFPADRLSARRPRYCLPDVSAGVSTLLPCAASYPGAWCPVPSLQSRPTARTPAPGLCASVPADFIRDPGVLRRTTASSTFSRP
jgi:hypothetical protein